MTDQNECEITSTYLWCHEFGSTTERACVGSIPHVLLAETIVRNLDVTIQGQKNVVKLQITVDNTVFVEVLKSQADFRSVEPVRNNILVSIHDSFFRDTTKTYCALFRPNWPL